ncbi:MAG: queuosine precursor transporter [Proteobacteria bacterium]|nr:queuosine precursor transporter [Pseudomonadota bacterium]MCG2741218.1 queuosine precursor transporter [Syntrophaceae bacterium]MBU1744039.1 queuosine precursor transporter [Pseudomonadota bacterium]MBU1966214.1 queuosine precursor transporter [Pseudomonadota bacterium]MBU4370318.1 queuosine precursor transporter [Pseudomonadota bacterium]
MAEQRWLPVIAAVFVTSLVVSNIIAVKLISVGPFLLTAAILIFPVSYIFGDILTEVYGYAQARRVIWIGFGCNLMAVFIFWLSIELPAAPFWRTGAFESAAASQQAYQAIFGSTPRILAASFLAYLVGEFLNSFVLAKMKITTRGRHLWMRTIGSTIVGQLADSGVFIFLAFYGTVPLNALAQMAGAQWLMKSAYEALATPLTYLAVSFLKRAEREDFYDRETNFNPLRWKE